MHEGKKGVPTKEGYTVASASTHYFFRSSERNAPTSFTFRASDLKRLFHMPISSWSTAMAVTLTPTSESTRNYESAQFRPSSGKSVKSLCKKRYVLCTILGKAMEVMLQHSVIHRDIKPQNILLCKGDPTASEVDLFDCTVKLTDFGAATMADRAASTVCGTFDYMAPEVIRCLAERRGSYDSKCDMFSVGVVLYQCVTGKHPFTVRQRPKNASALSSAFWTLWISSINQPLALQGVFKHGKSEIAFAFKAGHLAVRGRDHGLTPAYMR